MGTTKLPRGITRSKNGNYRVRFSKGGRRYNIGTFKTRKQAIDELGMALWNLPDDNDASHEYIKLPVGAPAYNPGKESLKTRMKRLAKRFTDYVEKI